MIARSRRLARDTIAEYRAAIRLFSPNARFYLAHVSMTDFSIGALYTVFAIYVKAAGMSEAIVGSVEGAIAFVGAIVCLLSPVLVAGYGYRRLLIAGAVLAGIARFGHAAIPLAGPMLAFAAIDGVSAGVYQALPVPFLSENSEAAERSHLFSADLFVRVIAAFLGGLAGGLLPLAFGLVTTEVGSYRATVAVVGAVLLAAAIPVLMIREERPHAPSALRKWVGEMKGFGSWSKTWRLLLPHVVISIGAGMIIPFLSLYLKNHLGASISEVGLISGISQLAMGAAAISAPLLARRFGLVRSTVLVEMSSLPFMFAIPLIGDLRIAAIVFWARAALMNLSWPLWSQFMVEGVPSGEKPVVAGVLAFGWSSAWVVGSVLGGRIMTTSYTAPFFYATALYAAGTLLTWLLNKDRDVKPQRMDEAIVQEVPQ